MVRRLFILSLAQSLGKMQNLKKKKKTASKTMFPGSGLPIEKEDGEQKIPNGKLNKLNLLRRRGGKKNKTLN